MITIIGEVGRPATQEEIDAFMGKRWKDVTPQEIAEIKRNQCAKCEYISGNESKKFTAEKTCNYILITGHSRGCSPMDCVLHGVFKRRRKGRKRGTVL